MTTRLDYQIPVRIDYVLRNALLREPESVTLSLDRYTAEQRRVALQIIRHGLHQHLLEGRKAMAAIAREVEFSAGCGDQSRVAAAAEAFLRLIGAVDQDGMLSESCRRKLGVTHECYDTDAALGHAGAA